MMRSSSRTTQRPESETSGIAPRHSFSDIIHDIQNTKAPPADELIVDEVERPARIRSVGGRDRRTGSDGAASSAPAADFQPFLAVNPLGLLTVHDNFRLENDVQAAITEPPAFMCELHHPCAQRRIVWPSRSIPDHRAVRSRTRFGTPAARSSHRSSEDSLGEQAFELPILQLQGFQPLRVGDLHPAKLGLPCIQRRRRHVVLAAKLGNRGPCFHVPSKYR